MNNWLNSRPKSYNENTLYNRVDYVSQGLALMITPFTVVQSMHVHVTVYVLWTWKITNFIFTNTLNIHHFKTD